VPLLRLAVARVGEAASFVFILYLQYNLMEMLAQAISNSGPQASDLYLW